MAVPTPGGPSEDHVAAGVAVALALGILIIDATVDGGVAIDAGRIDVDRAMA